MAKLLEWMKKDHLRRKRKAVKSLRKVQGKEIPQ